jgi:hypothetical protein
MDVDENMDSGELLVENVYYVAKIPISELRKITWETWETVLDGFIQTLFDSWWGRCLTVIDAQGGPTQY